MIRWISSIRPGDETGIQSRFNFRLLIDIDSGHSTMKNVPALFHQKRRTESTVSTETFVISDDETHFFHE